jgi:hypothetical protein
VEEAWDQRLEGRIRFDLRGIDIELPAPHQSRFLAEFDDLLEKAGEDVDAQALLDVGQAQMIWQILVQPVPE